MNHLKCREITVHFKSAHNGQRISADEDTRAHYLQIIQDDKDLRICYCRANGESVKVIVFNYENVREYHCENLIYEPKAE